MTHTLTLDWTRCRGHGVCSAALGERISLDRWGYPDGIDRGGAEVTADLLPAARMAVHTCPAAALRLERTPATGRK